MAMEENEDMEKYGKLATTYFRHGRCCCKGSRAWKEEKMRDRDF
jgi:hypothetical protein